jgi:hypothetical protein
MQPKLIQERARVASCFVCRQQRHAHSRWTDGEGFDGLTGPEAGSVGVHHNVQRHIRSARTCSPLLARFGSPKASRSGRFYTPHLFEFRHQEGIKKFERCLERIGLNRVRWSQDKER